MPNSIMKLLNLVLKGGIKVLIYLFFIWTGATNTSRWKKLMKTLLCFYRMQNLPNRCIFLYLSATFSFFYVEIVAKT